MTAEAFTARLLEDCALAPGSHVLVALSGGADSTALFCLFLEVAAAYPLRVSCAHVEHGIRGDASMSDLAFVRALCAQRGVPLYAAHVDAPACARRMGCGLEEAARVLRYDFLQKTARETGAHAIALAHHADDQAETVLLHAMRGSDVRGLCAMRWRRGNLIRPLLDVNARSLRAYLAQKGQPFCQDETNQDTAYTRNKIRLDVLPAMEQASGGVRGALCRLARAAQRDEDYFSRQLDALRLQVIRLTDGAAVEKQALAGLHPALLSRALVGMMESAGIPPQGAQTIDALMASLESRQAVVNLTGGAHASVGRRYLCLTREQPPPEDTALAVPGVTDTPFGRFLVRAALPGETGDGRRSQRMPASLLRGAYVTARKEGDAMVPFGRHTPVKLKKLMIDAGVERAMRASVPVVRGECGVLFAVGLRPSACCESAQADDMLLMFEGEIPFAQQEAAAGHGQPDAQ